MLENVYIERYIEKGMISYDDMGISISVVALLLFWSIPLATSLVCTLFIYLMMLVFEVFSLIDLHVFLLSLAEQFDLYDNFYVLVLIGDPSLFNL